MKLSVRPAQLIQHSRPKTDINTLLNYAKDIKYRPFAQGITHHEHKKRIHRPKSIPYTKIQALLANNHLQHGCNILVQT